VETDAVVAECKRILDRIAAEGLKTNLSVKLTHIGLVLGEELAYTNVAALVEHAKVRGNFVRIDMEESAYVDVTLRIFRRLREAGHVNVGTVLQSYLYRSEADLASLLDLAPNLRLVKGAYLETADVAFPNKADVDACFVRLVERSLADGGFTAVATHDERLIEHVIGFADREEIARERFQFQLLYGVRPQLQLSLVSRGYDVLVATPYGPNWYRYLMRRLAERPANTLFILKNLVRR
jgi:proline dehydrogenase